MSYSLFEFYPSKPVLKLGTESCTISLITLRHEVIFAEKYESTAKMFNYLKEKPEIITEIIWDLLEDKAAFKNSFSEFDKKLKSITMLGSLSETVTSMVKCLNDSMAKSIPLIKNVKRHKEIQEITQSTEGLKVCYVGYYDSVAKRYGYSLEEFYALTLRQLHMILKTIGEKTYDELEIQASLSGKKLKPRIKYDDITEEQEQDQEAQAMEALKRLQEKYQKEQEAKKEK